MPEILALMQKMQDTDVEWLLSVGSTRKLPDHEQLIAAGQRPDSVFVVLDGVLGVYGRDLELKLATLGAGDVVGEMTWLESRAPTESVIALEPSSVLCVSYRALDAKVSEDSPFASRLYRALGQSLVERLRRVNLRLSLKNDGDAAQLSRSSVWLTIADGLNQFKELVHRANDAARQNNDTVPDDVAQPVLAAFQQFLPFLESAIGDASVEDERTKQEIGVRVQHELLPYLLLTECGERFLNKPRGYAGDYWTIELVYRNRPVGASPVGRLLDRCLLESPQTIAVRNRRELISEEIQKTVAAKTGDAARVTSLACGPAEEIFDAIQMLGPSAGLQVALIDFDYQALAFVAERRDRLHLQRTISLVAENLIHLAVGRTQIRIEAQDLVYSIGLIDYFDDELVVKLLNLVHGMLRPGGRVMVGNFHPRNTAKAFMDHVLEWRLKHRTEQDMDRLFSSSRFGRPSTAIRYESQRINLFAECVKT